MRQSSPGAAQATNALALSTRNLGTRNSTPIRTLTPAPNRRSQHCDYRARGRLPAGIQVTAEDVTSRDRRLIGRGNGIGKVSRAHRVVNCARLNELISTLDSNRLGVSCQPAS